MLVPGALLVPGAAIVGGDKVVVPDAVASDHFADHGLLWPLLVAARTCQKYVVPALSAPAWGVYEIAPKVSTLTQLLQVATSPLGRSEGFAAIMIR